MGNCYKVQTRESAQRVFSKHVCIEIRTTSHPEKIKFTTTKAEKLNTLLFSTSNLDLKISYCVLPGLDPRGQIKKSCQDQVLVSEKADSLLAGVFDGHGKHGREVVDFCANFMQNFFISHEFDESPQDYMISMIEECDRVLLEESKINCSTSGTTAVMVLINSVGIWTSSVGDSRAVLGCLPKHPKMVEMRDHPGSKYKQPIIPSRVLKAVQISLDQKPNISYELERIIKSGGVVSQITSSLGQKIGPYRIWKHESQIPGLAMSRSLGDTIAKKIGVISKPVSYSIKTCTQRDLFIVMGTDGIWDVMENIQVCEFVDKYKSVCVSTPNKDKEKVSENNSCIAEFLCEEARHRWLEICSEEDVAIDDISGIVIEIKPKKGFVTEMSKRKGVSPENILEIAQESQADIKITERFDIRRGSNAVIEEEENEEEND